MKIANVWWTNFIICHDSRAFKIWQIFIGILSVVSVVCSLYWAAFDFSYEFSWHDMSTKFYSKSHQNTILIIWILIECLYIIDIVCGFLTDYISEESIYPVKNIEKIALRYVKGNFIFDFIAVFPFVTIVESFSIENMNNGYSYHKLFFLLKLTRLKKASFIFGTKFFS